MAKPFKDCVYVYHPKGSVTQFFAENPQLYSTVCAAPGTCLYGGHNGIDLVAPWGTPIFAVKGGKVVEVKDTPSGYGKHIRILSNDTDGLLEWVYGHLSRIDVSVGQIVSEGFQVGLMGNTGFVVSGATPFWKTNPYAGTHLHLGVRPLKPATTSWDISYPTGDKANVVSYNNGYFGSVDPMQFLTGLAPIPDVSNLTGEKRLTAISILNQLKVLYAQLLKGASGS